jgi:hypothetical protein
VNTRFYIWCEAAAHSSASCSDGPYEWGIHLGAGNIAIDRLPTIWQGILSHILKDHDCEEIGACWCRQSCGRTDAKQHRYPIHLRHCRSLNSRHYWFVKPHVEILIIHLQIFTLLELHFTSFFACVLRFVAGISFLSEVNRIVTQVITRGDVVLRLQGSGFCDLKPNRCIALRPNQ